MGFHGIASVQLRQVHALVNYQQISLQDHNFSQNAAILFLQLPVQWLSLTFLLLVGLTYRQLSTVFRPTLSFSFSQVVPQSVDLEKRGDKKSLCGYQRSAEGNDCVNRCSKLQFEHYYASNTRFYVSFRVVSRKEKITSVLWGSVCLCIH